MLGERPGRVEKPGTDCRMRNATDGSRADKVRLRSTTPMRRRAGEVGFAQPECTFARNETLMCGVLSGLGGEE